LLYSPHGRHLVSSGADGRMRLWHPQTGEMQIVNFGAFPQNAQSNYKRVQMAISWNANVVFHPRGNDVIVCDLESGDRMACLSAHMATVYCCVAQVRLSRHAVGLFCLYTRSLFAQVCLSCRSLLP
jgi:WD40 repeat protein